MLRQYSIKFHVIHSAAWRASWRWFRPSPACAVLDKFWGKNCFWFFFPWYLSCWLRKHDRWLRKKGAKHVFSLKSRSNESAKSEERKKRELLVGFFFNCQENLCQRYLKIFCCCMTQYCQGALKITFSISYVSKFSFKCHRLFIFPISSGSTYQSLISTSSFPQFDSLNPQKKSEMTIKQMFPVILCRFRINCLFLMPKGCLKKALFCKQWFIRNSECIRSFCDPSLISLHVEMKE